MRLIKSFLFSVFIFTSTISNGQIIWQENFNNGCATGCLASSHSTWTVVKAAAHKSQGNVWYVSSSEKGGIPAGSCGVVGPGDGTLHIGNVSTSPLAPLACPAGDCRASYDGGYTISGVPQGDVSSDIRAITPTINCNSYGGSISVSFLYMEGGNLSTDNFTVDYSADNGATWALLKDPPKTVNTGCASGIGKWTEYSIPLPVSSKNNPNVKLGFRWVNNNDPTGDDDPSVAIDRIVVCQSSTSANFTVSNAAPCVNTCVDFTDISTSVCSNIAVWSWTFPGGTPGSFIGQTPPKICYSTVGAYNVQLYVQDADGFSNTISLQGFINVKNCNVLTTAFTSNKSSICKDDCILFSDQTSGGTKPYTYQWAFTGGNPTNSTLSGLSVCYPAAGNYAVQLTVTDANGFTNSKSTPNYVTVTDCGSAPVIDFNASKTTICVGECVAFSDASINSPTNWTWAFSPTTGVTPATSNSQNPSICFNTPGTYDVTLDASNAAGSGTPKTKIAYITVNSCPAPLITDFSINPGNKILCTDDCATFTDLSTSGGTIDTWFWTFQGGNPSTYLGQNPPQVCYDTNGTYSVTLYCHDSNNNSQTHQEFITVKTCSGINPAGLASATDICTGGCVSFTDQSTATVGNIIGWEWTFYGADPPSSTVQNPPLICYPTGGIYPIKLKVYTTSAVDSAILPFTINAYDPVVVRTNFDTITIIKGTSQQINASGGVSYSWSDSPPGSITSYNRSSILVHPSDTTSYTVVMTDATGCTSTKTVVVNVIPPNLVWAPTAFAPGGLPENRTFHLFITGFVSSVQFKVFNRWGEMMFTTTDQNGSWDGRYNGTPVNSGVYVYYYKVTFTDGTEVKQSGDVTLLR